MARFVLSAALLLCVALFASTVRAGTDFYALVGARPGCDAKALRTAFRKTSLKWHPDRFVGRSAEDRAEAEKMTQAISFAYKVLSNAETRKLYDLGGYEDHFLLGEDEDENGEKKPAAGAFRLGSVSDLHSESSLTFSSESHFRTEVATESLIGRPFSWAADGAVPDRIAGESRAVWIVQLYRHDNERCARFSEAWERVASSHAPVDGRNVPAVRFGRVHVTVLRPVVESFFDQRVPRGRLPVVVAIHPNGTAAVHKGQLTRSAVSQFVDSQIPKSIVTEVLTVDEYEAWEADARSRGLVRVVILSEKSRAPSVVREVALRASATVAVAHIRYKENRRQARRLARRLGLGSGKAAKKGKKDGKSRAGPLSESDLPVVAALREPGLPRSIGRRVDLRSDLGQWVDQRSVPNVVELAPETARAACVSRRCVVAVVPPGSRAKAIGGLVNPNSDAGKGEPGHGAVLRALAETVAEHNAELDRKEQKKRRAQGQTGRKTARPSGLVQGAWVDAGRHPEFAAAMEAFVGNANGNGVVVFAADRRAERPRVAGIRVDGGAGIAASREAIAPLVKAASRGSSGADKDSKQNGGVAWAEFKGSDKDGGDWPDLSGGDPPASWSLDGSKPASAAGGGDDDVEVDPAEVIPFVVVVIAALAYFARGPIARLGRSLRGGGSARGGDDAWIDPTRDRTGAAAGGKSKKDKKKDK